MKLLDLAVKRLGSTSFNKPKLMQFHIDKLIGPGTGDASGVTTLRYQSETQPIAEVVVAETFANLQAATEPVVATNLYAQDFTTGISAGATQTQAGATQLTTYINVVATAAASGDGVKLPTAVAEKVVVIVNNGANPIKVWPFTGDTIEGGAVDAAYAVLVPAKSKIHFWAKDAVNWFVVSPTNI